MVMYSDKFPVKAKGIGRVFKAFLNSINGLRVALRHEQAFQQEVVLGVLCIIAIPFLQTSALESAILIVAVVLVWITELLNSGLEWTIDYISEDYSKGQYESKFVFNVDKKFASSCGCGVSFSPKNLD